MILNFTEEAKTTLTLTFSEMEELNDSLMAQLNYLFSREDCPTSLIEHYAALFMEFNSFCRKVGNNHMTREYEQELRTKIACHRAIKQSKEN